LIGLSLESLLHVDTAQTIREFGHSGTRLFALDAKAWLLSIRRQHETIVRRTLDRSPLVHIERLRLRGRDDMSLASLRSLHVLVWFHLHDLGRLVAWRRSSGVSA
jgi:hypothetical protein